MMIKILVVASVLTVGLAHYTVAQQARRRRPLPARRPRPTRRPLFRVVSGAFRPIILSAAFRRIILSTFRPIIPSAAKTQRHPGGADAETIAFAAAQHGA